MALCCIISEIKRDIDRKSYFAARDVPVRRGDPRRNITVTFGTEKNTGMVWLLDGEKTLMTY